MGVKSPVRLGLFAGFVAFGCATATQQSDAPPSAAISQLGFSCPASETHHLFAGMNHTCALVGSERRAVCWGGDLERTLSFGKADDQHLHFAVCESPAAHIAASGEVQREERPIIAEPTQPTQPNGKPICVLRVPPLEPPRCATTPFDAGVSEVRDLSFSTNIGCAVMMDGTARCWGPDPFDTEAWSFDLPALQGAIRVVADHAGPAYGLYADGRVSCGGSAESRARPPCNTAKDAFARIATRVVQLEVQPLGAVCAVTVDQQLICRGGSDLYRCRGASCKAISELRVRRVAVAGERRCAQTADDSVVCWGKWGHVDRVHDGMFMPEGVVGLPPVVTLAGGAGHACAVARDGAVYCWGRRTPAEASDDLGKVRIPVVRAERIEGVPPLCELAGGLYHMCGLGADGAVYCWGGNHYGQLGSGDRVEHRDRAVRTLPPGSVDWSR